MSHPSRGTSDLTQNYTLFAHCTASFTLSLIKKCVQYHGWIQKSYNQLKSSFPDSQSDASISLFLKRRTTLDIVTTKCITSFEIHDITTVQKTHCNFVWGRLEQWNVCECPWLPLICVAILVFTQHKTRFIIWHFPYASLSKSDYLHKCPFTSRTFYTRLFVKHLYCQGHSLLLCESISTNKVA